MSKPKVWTLPELLDRIWSMSRGKRTAVATGEMQKVPRHPPGAVIMSDPNCNPMKELYDYAPVIKRTVLGWDADFKPCTYELNKISAASAAALYERIKFKRREKGKAAPRYMHVCGYPGSDELVGHVQGLLNIGWTTHGLHVLNEQRVLQEMILYPEDAV